MLLCFLYNFLFKCNPFVKHPAQPIRKPFATFRPWSTSLPSLPRRRPTALAHHGHQDCFRRCACQSRWNSATTTATTTTTVSETTTQPKTPHRHSSSDYAFPGHRRAAQMMANMTGRPKRVASASACSVTDCNIYACQEI